MNWFKWFKDEPEESEKEQFQKRLDRLKKVGDEVEEKVNILEQTIRELRPNGQ